MGLQDEGEDWRTLATLRRGWRLLRLPFLLYGRLFMRVTQAVSRRQEFVADQLAARIVGAQPLASALRSGAAASMGFRSYWSHEYLPVLNAGYRPPLMGASIPSSPIQRFMM